MKNICYNIRAVLRRVLKKDFLLNITSEYKGDTIKSICYKTNIGQTERYTIRYDIDNVIKLKLK